MVSRVGSFRVMGLGGCVRLGKFIHFAEDEEGRNDDGESEDTASSSTFRDGV